MLTQLKSEIARSKSFYYGLMRRAKSLAGYAPEFKTAKTALDLSTDALTLFNFLTLLVDIRYRHSHGRQIVSDNSKGYSKRMLTHSRLPEHTSSVDIGLEGYLSAEVV